MSFSRENTRLVGHALTYCGPIYSAYASAHAKIVKAAVARCECGLESPDLQRKAACRRWHRQHKLDIVAATEK